jgi:hypothetical protein
LDRSNTVPDPAAFTPKWVTYQWTVNPDPPPWQALRKPLARSGLALVASGGIYAAGQVAFHHKGFKEREDKHTSSHDIKLMAVAAGLRAGVPPRRADVMSLVEGYFRHLLCLDLVRETADGSYFAGFSS